MKHVLWITSIVLVAGCRPVQQQRTEAPAAAKPGAQPRREEPEASGYRLAYVAARGGLYVRSTQEGEDDWLVAPDVESVAHSAEGMRVAYADVDRNLSWVNLATGDQQTVAPGDEVDRYGFDISPDGGKVAYVSEGQVKVWIRGGGAQTVEGPKHCTGATWSPDSQRLAIGAMAGKEMEDKDGGVWVWDGTGPAERSVPAKTDDWGSSRDIMWSPDGEWLAWARGAGDGWAGDIARADGSDLKRDAIAAGPIEWAPDSSGLLVSVHVEAGAFRVGYYDLAAGELTAFGGEYDDAVGCLSPDGKRALVFQRAQKARGLLVDLATGEESEWGPPVRADSAAWGPKGTIAVAGSGQNGELMLLPEDGTALSMLGVAVSSHPKALRWTRIGSGG